MNIIVRSLLAVRTAVFVCGWSPFLMFYLRERKKRKNRKNILEVVIIGAVETVEKPAKAYSSRK